VTTLFTVVLVLASTAAAPSLLYFLIGGLRYKISNGDSRAARAGIETMVSSAIGSVCATLLAVIIWILGSALIPTWTPAPGLILAVALVGSAPFLLVALAASYVGALRGLLAVIRRAIHVAARLLPAAERDEYAEVHLAMLHRVRRRGELWRLWPLISNILFCSPFVAFQRHRAQARLRRAVVAERQPATQ
jgi:hypothetical protein